MGFLATKFIRKTQNSLVMKEFTADEGYYLVEDKKKVLYKQAFVPDSYESLRISQLPIAECEALLKKEEEKG